MLWSWAGDFLSCLGRGLPIMCEDRDLSGRGHRWQVMVSLRGLQWSLCEKKCKSDSVAAWGRQEDVLGWCSQCRRQAGSPQKEQVSSSCGFTVPLMLLLGESHTRQLTKQKRTAQIRRRSVQKLSIKEWVWTCPTITWQLAQSLQLNSWVTFGILFHWKDYRIVKIHPI